MIEELKMRITDVLMRDATCWRNAPEWVQMRSACELQAENIVAALGLEEDTMIAEIDGETVEFVRFITPWEQRG